jgi:hypothetical protein
MEYSQYQHQQQYQLPPGWVETTDPTTGRAYYANATTGESSWDKPYTLTPFQPPPPPQLQQYFPHQQQYQSMNSQYSNSYYGQSDQNTWNQYPRKDSVPPDENLSDNKYAYEHYRSNSQQNPQQFCSSAPTQAPQQGPQKTQESNFVRADSNNINPMTTSCDGAMTEESDPIDTELTLLSAGQISDLFYIQQQEQQLHFETIGTGSSLPPPYSVPLSVGQQQQLHRPRQEIGRLQTRYFALREQLKQFHVSE